MDISPEEREIIIFLMGIKDIELLKEYLFNNQDMEKIIIKARQVIKEGLDFYEWDDSGTYKNYYECKYCGLGQHEGDTRLLFFDRDFRIQRRCQNKKYFKHKIDCPMLIAKDLLTGEWKIMRIKQSLFHLISLCVK